MTQAVNFWRSALNHAHSIGIKPAQFWQLSLVEWRAINLGAGTDTNIMMRADFEKLAVQFED